MLLEQRALCIGVDCLTEFPIQSVEKLEREPQNFSRAPLPFANYSCGTHALALLAEILLRPCNEIRNSDRKAACVFVCVCVCGGGGGGGRQSVYLPPPPPPPPLPPVTGKPPRHCLKGDFLPKDIASLNHKRGIGRCNTGTKLMQEPYLIDLV